jgi:hypothetical protein
MTVRRGLYARRGGSQNPAMTVARPPMRAAWLLIPVLLLTACHKPHDAEPSDAPRGLKVESYDAPIPKAPLKGGKLETMRPRPQEVAPTPPVSDASPASGEAPAVQPPG